ncbi:MAG TPA: HAMP domain-containing sensor histidine kinase [Candidatus Binatia bacterium]|jgi:signal transduction histidine kinase
MPSKLLSGLRKTLIFRLTLSYSLIFVASTMMLFGLSYFFLTASVRDNQKIIQSRLKRFVTLAQNGGIPAVLQAAGDRHNKFFVRVAGPDNQTVFMSPPQSWSKFDLQTVEERPVETDWQYFHARTDADVLEVTAAHLANGYTLQVGNDIEDRKEILEDFREATLAVMLPILVIGLAGGAFFAFRVTRPIRNLVQITRSIVETGNMDARVPVVGDDELNELGKLFNRMLEKIETLVQGMRGALDNVAHDLRTPMARLRAIAETALQSDSGRQGRKEALIACLEESERVLTLLDTLMDISEAETGTMKLDLAPVNVSALMGEIVELYEYVAEAEEVAVSFNAPKDICMRADRNRMRQVLANLVDNAVKYTGPGGSIVLSACERDNQILIRVQDTGPGISPAEIPKIWDRLHRGDASRSRPGLGLGLSLVAAVVKAHDGLIAVESALGSGSVFTLYMPVAPQPQLSVAV